VSMSSFTTLRLPPTHFTNGAASPGLRCGGSSGVQGLIRAKRSRAWLKGTSRIMGSSLGCVIGYQLLIGQSSVAVLQQGQEATPLSSARL